MKKQKSIHFKICSKTGKMIKINHAKKKLKFFNIFLFPIVYPLIGLLSLIWLLIRVLPKPSRINYPCIKAAFPFASSFLASIVSLGIITWFYKVFKKAFSNKKIVFGVLFCILFSGACAIYFAILSPNLFTLENANKPIGNAKGINPGRVVWVYDENATSFNGSGSYWKDEYNDQTLINNMISLAIKSISGESNDSASWDKIFKYYNKSKGYGNKGYQSGEKIAIKINQNNCKTHGDTDGLNGNPHLIFALVESLIINAKVPQSNIAVYDTSRFIGSNIYNKIKNKYPEVELWDSAGGDGRKKAVWIKNAIPYSDPKSNNAKGLPTVLVNATYHINMALLKGHTAAGVTLTGKNFFGATSINPNDWTKNNHYQMFGENKDRYLTLVDYFGHKDMGGKTILWIIDGLYSSEGQNDESIRKWKMSPFNNDWTSSIFVSQDPVAVDSVGLDMLTTEWPSLKNKGKSDKYLHEAALANNPPSGTFYDPERDGSRLASLGVHEHWNNAKDKQYSRNLGSSTGIELIYINPNLSKKH